MKKTALLALICTLLLTACGGSKPPNANTPAPEAHCGVFVSEYGSLSFIGDGHSVVFDFSEELAEATGLPCGKQKGTYVFLFQHGEWRYDKAERFRIEVSGLSYDFVNYFSLTDENTITLQSPVNPEETIAFVKGGPDA